MCFCKETDEDDRVDTARGPAAQRHQDKQISPFHHLNSSNHPKNGKERQYHSANVH